MSAKSDSCIMHETPYFCSHHHHRLSSCQQPTRIEVKTDTHTPHAFNHNCTQLRAFHLKPSAMKIAPLAFLSFQGSRLESRPTSLQQVETRLHAGESLGVNFITTGIPSFLTASEAVTVPQKTFEAVAPDTSILIGFGIVSVLSVIASQVWANEVVPISRTKLALSKRDGEVKEYLDGLKQASYYNSTTEGELDMKNLEIKPNIGDGRDVERWLFSDWLNTNKSASGGGGRKKEPALPILKKAKWNSGDNPVLVTAALMMIGIVVASVTERVGGSGF